MDLLRNLSFRIRRDSVVKDETAAPTKEQEKPKLEKPPELRGTDISTWCTGVFHSAAYPHPHSATHTRPAFICTNNRARSLAHVRAFTPTHTCALSRIGTPALHTSDLLHTHTGWLMKRGDKGLIKTWKKRYFVLVSV